MTYELHIYDGNPNSCSCDAWDEIDIDDLEDAQHALESACSGLNASDGYAVGDVIYGTVDDDDGECHTFTYTLTEDDVG